MDSIGSGRKALSVTRVNVLLLTDSGVSSSGACNRDSENLCKTERRPHDSTKEEFQINI